MDGLIAEKIWKYEEKGGANFRSETPRQNSYIRGGVSRTQGSKKKEYKPEPNGLGEQTSRSKKEGRGGTGAMTKTSGGRGRAEVVPASERTAGRRKLRVGVWGGLD